MKQNPKSLWARNQLKVRLKGISDNEIKKEIFKKVWAEAKAKFG